MEEVSSERSSSVYYTHCTLCFRCTHPCLPIGKHNDSCKYSNDVQPTCCLDQFVAEENWSVASFGAWIDFLFHLCSHDWHIVYQYFITEVIGHVLRWASAHSWRRGSVLGSQDDPGGSGDSAFIPSSWCLLIHATTCYNLNNLNIKKRHFKMSWLVLFPSSTQLEEFYLLWF